MTIGPGPGDSYLLTDQGGWARRVWLCLSIANVWACGVGTARHETRGYRTTTTPGSDSMPERLRERGE